MKIQRTHAAPVELGRMVGVALQVADGRSGAVRISTRDAMRFAEQLVVACKQAEHMQMNWLETQTAPAVKK